MHGARDLAVRRDVPRHRQATRKGLQPTGNIRRKAAGDHEPNAAARARREIRSEFAEIARMVFQTRVHRAHQHAVGQGAEAQIQRSEQVRIRRGGRVGHGVERAFESAHDARIRLRRQGLRQSTNCLLAGSCSLLRNRKDFAFHSATASIGSSALKAPETSVATGMPSR